jgi:ssDNA-binding Zn-finger/Zn-ribbon topoisomerase 1
MPDKRKVVMCPQCETMMEAIRPYGRVMACDHTVPDQYSQFRNQSWIERVEWIYECPKCLNQESIRDDGRKDA